MRDRVAVRVAGPGTMWDEKLIDVAGRALTAITIAWASSVSRVRLVALAAVLLALPCRISAQTALQPPITPACVSSPFDWRHPVGPHAPAGFHNGIDLPAPAGALVHAAAAGRVLMIKRQGLGGVTVQLQHPGGMITLYAHLGNLVPALAEGTRNVVAGAPLGHVARTGVTYGTHIFFAVLVNGQAVDPLTYLAVPRC